MVKAAQAILALEDLKAEAAADPSIFVDGPSHSAWRAKVLSVLLTAMGSDNETMIAFRDLPYNVPVWVGGPNAAAEDAQHFREAVEHGVALIDAAILALNLDADNDPALLPLPRPEGREQEILIEIISDWFERHATWPTYGQVKRRYAQRANSDCVDCWRALPDGLVNPSPPPSIPSSSQPMSLTLAGAIERGFDSDLFLGLLRLAVDRWLDADDESEDDTVRISSEDAANLAVGELSPPESRLLLWLLTSSEPLRASSSNPPDGMWTVTFTADSDIDRFRHLESIEDYWQRRTKFLTGGRTPVTWQPQPAAEAMEHAPTSGTSVSSGLDSSMFDQDLWEHVRHAVAAETWSTVASQAIIFLEDTVRRRAGSPVAKGGGTLFGKDLLVKVLAADGPIPLAESANEIDGWRSLGQGLVAATGNRDRHHIQKRDDWRRYALGVLGTASLILTQIKHVHGLEDDAVTSVDDATTPTETPTER